jgi:hypothetical protein
MRLALWTSVPLNDYIKSLSTYEIDVKADPRVSTLAKKLKFTGVSGIPGYPLQSTL